MQVISSAASLVAKIIGKQNLAANQSYRLMSFVIQCPVDDGVLLYHTLTCCFVIISKEEANNITVKRELIENWFLVPMQHDDVKLCQQVMQVVRLFRPHAKAINGYTILTTTSCNARCFYCYERGATPLTMSISTAEKVSRYILSCRGDEKVKLSWFGGEPLVNIPVIDLICNRLGENNVPFNSRMTSNGYLFDEEIVQRAKTLWHLLEVQITLDGKEQTYNRIKRFVYKDASPFKRVMRNIGLLITAGINVTVRLNIDKYNFDEMSDLVTHLYQSFGANEHLTIYSHELFGERSSEDRAALYRQRLMLENQISECGYRKKRRLPHKPVLNRCMADDDRTVLISPSGDLGKCEHFIDHDFYGHIDKKEIDTQILGKYQEHPVDTVDCATCPYYPQCIRLSACPNGSICTPEIKEENIRLTQIAMKDEYQTYLNKQPHATQI